MFPILTIALNHYFKKSKSKVKKQKVSEEKKDKTGKINKVVKRKKRQKKQGKVVKRNGIIDDTGDTTQDQAVLNKKLDKEDDDTLQSRMSAWNGLGVPSILLRALADKSFSAPTKIQVTLSLLSCVISAYFQLFS